MTMFKNVNTILTSLLYLSWNIVILDIQLTFISPVNLWFTDKGRTVALVCAQENISGVGVAATNVTIDALITSAIMPLILVPLTTAEETVPLFTETQIHNIWLTFCQVNLISLYSTLTINVLNF